MTTPKARGSSPWRIKVTVEAQPHNSFSQDENSPENGTPTRKTRKSVTRSPDENEADSSHSDASYHPTKRGGARGRRSMSTDIHVPEPIRAAAMYGPRSPYQIEDEMGDVQGDASRATRSSVGQRRRSMRLSSQPQVTPDLIEEVQEQEASDHEQTPKASSSKKATTDEEMWRSMISNHQYESEQTTEEEHDSSDDDLDIVMSDQTIGDATIAHSEDCP
ncbi:hypothetical protein UCDDS831_g05485 [Diplodia seriata]|uniref:Uncharacterized protein n=1 Tax=Diplodia seriata TaxID=420778 RepID=A0A0G2GR33_9PEZI|nr:hypothetical protein UCDDS831_g05485 [Diplodia seriata]